jgi:hypothetical protein
MILYNKTTDELNDEAYALLQQTNLVDPETNQPGLVAQKLLGVVNELLGTFYETLDINVMMSLVSRATGDILDEIGYLLNCSRNPNEEDDDYRARIVKQVYVAEGANKTALKLKALSVEGVNDVVLTPWVYGTGSFTVHVITESMDEIDTVVAAVQEVIDEVQAFGVKGVAVTPKILALAMSLSVGFGSKVGEEQRNALLESIATDIKNYVNGLAMGEQFVAAKVVQLILDENDGITDVEITAMAVNGKAVVIGNYQPYWDEKLYVESESGITVV